MDRLGLTVGNCTDPARPHIYGCPPRNYMTRYLCGHGAPCADPPDDATFALVRVVDAMRGVQSVFRATDRSDVPFSHWRPG